MHLTHPNFKSIKVVKRFSAALIAVLLLCVAPSFAAAATTTLSSGTDPSSFTIAPGSTATSVDQFVFQTDTGSDTITAVTVSLPSVEAVSLLEIVNETGSTVYGTTSTFSLNSTTTGFESGTLGLFTAGGDLPFTATNTASNQGSWSAVSGAIGDDASSTLSYTKTYSTAGAIQFSYKVSSETDYDFLTFFIDGVQQGSWTGLLDWATSTLFAVSAGSHTFTWAYTKDSCCTDGTDQVWIDDVVTSEGYVATISLSNATFAVSTSATTSKIRLTPKTHAALAPAAYTTGAFVSGWTGTNTKDGTDSSATVLSIDNVAPGVVASASVTGGASPTATYTTPADTDLSRVVILRSESVVIDTPVDGTVYSVNDTIGAATVACVDTAVTPSTSDECVTTGLSSTTPYYFKIFSVDLYGNYGSGVVPSGSPINIQPIIVSGTLYSDEGVTPITTGKTIKIAVGTSTVGVFSTTTNASGAWSVTLPSGHEMAVGTPVLAFVDGDSSTPAVSVTKAKDITSGMSGVDLYRDRLVIAHEATTGASVSNTDLAFYDRDNDVDIPFTSTAGTLSISAGIELHVRSGKTFNPSGPLMIHANASASSLDGTLHLAPGSIYVSGDVTKVGGNLFASSTASITGVGTLLFTATTTGKVIIATSTSIGSVSFIGNGGSWTFGGNATTTNLTIGSGTTVTAPTSITIQGSYHNEGTFTHNSGSVIFREPLSASFAGIDSNGGYTSGAGSVFSVAVKGNYLYAGKHDDYTGVCSQVAGSASGCELMVFDISSSTHPVYVAGRDQQGTAVGTVDLGRFHSLVISGDYLFVGKGSDVTPCSQTPGSAIGCELQVYDISSSTNPVYVAGRDSTGDDAGTGGYSFYKLAISGNQLFVGKSGNSTACSQVAGSAIGCELMVFDITDPTNPTYTAGRDMNGSATGSTGNSSWLGVRDIFASGNYLYVGKGYDSTACSQVAGSALGCELMIYDISSSTNPVYVAGRDASGNSTGTQMENILSFAISGDTLFVGKDINNTTCSQTAGSAIGCELMVFDISSSTNPVFVAGRDVSGGSTIGDTLSSTFLSGLDAMKIFGTTLYLGYDGNPVPCVPVAGKAQGCELQMFDISSTTKPLFVNALDSTNGFAATGDRGITALAASNGLLFAGKDSFYGGCTSASEFFGCGEIIVASLPLPGSVLSGNMIGNNTWNALDIEGAQVALGDSATTTTFSSSVGSTLVTAAPFSVEGNFTNNGTLDTNDTIYFDGTTAQSISGSLTGLGGLNDILFRNSGTKSILSNASTTHLTIEASSGDVSAAGALSVEALFQNGGTFIAPTVFLLDGDYVNTGTFTHNSGEFLVRGQALTDMIVRDSSGSAAGTSDTRARVMVANDNTLFVGMYTFTTSACSQTIGSAGGCELQVYDISSSTNPVYVAGRDIDGSANGTGRQEITSMVLHGNMLYVGQYSSTTACGQTAGSAIGCEIQVYDISSSTNPVYVAGRDIDGSANGTTWGNYYSIDTMTVSNNTLYVGGQSSSTPCAQVAGSAAGCELQVYDISSTTNPIYVAGRDADASSSGVSQYFRANDMVVRSGYLYVAGDASDDACGQISGSAIGCELKIYDISSTTNPVYVAGMDTNGTATGTMYSSFSNLAISGDSLFATKYGDTSGCTDVPGQTTGCEFMVFNISSSTNPSYVHGWDISGNPEGLGSGSSGVSSLQVLGDRLFAARDSNSTGCMQIPGFAIGCELQVYDISSTTRPVYTAGLDAGGTRSGSTGEPFFSMAFSGSRIYLAKYGYSTACALADNTGCDILSFRLNNNLSGTMTGTSAFHDLTIANTAALGSTSQAVMFKNVASSTGMFTMKAGSSMQLPANATSSFQDISLLGSSSSPVYMRSSIDGTRTAFLVLGSQSQVTYVNVKDNSACPTTITNTGGIDAGNNLCWTFVPDIPVIIYSGTLYSDEGITPITMLVPLKVAVGTSTTGVFATSTFANGTWSLDLGYSSGIVEGTPILIWTDASTTMRAALFTKANASSSVSGLDLYQNRVIISQETSSSTAISDLAFYDVDDDGDIQFNASSTARTLTVSAGNELHVQTGKTFAPGGNVTIAGNAGSGVDGSLHLPSGSTYAASATTTIAGNFTASSSATINSNGGVFTFNATSTGKTISIPQQLGDLLFAGTGSYTFAANATVTALTINTGATVVAPPQLTLTGDLVNNGTYTAGSGTTTFANPGSAWTIRSAASSSWSDIVYGNGRFVAVASGTAIYSDDGITWATSSSVVPGVWRSVTYGNGLFVAVGTLCIMTSPDGDVWTARSSPFDSDWVSIAYGNDRYVVIGDWNESINLTSVDGITWATTSIPDSSIWVTDIAYGNGVFAAISKGYNRVLTSPDGTNWVVRAGVSDEWTDLAFGNGLFVAVSEWGDDVIETSPDGITWTTSFASDYNIGLYGVTYGDGLFVAVGDCSGNCIYISPDGYRWTRKYEPTGQGWWQSVAYGEGKYVAVSSIQPEMVMSANKNDLMFSENDGYQTAIGTFSGASAFHDIVVFGTTTGNVYLRSNASSTNFKVSSGEFFGPEDLSISENFSNSGTLHLKTGPWIPGTPAQSNNWYGLAYGNDIFVAVSANGTNRVMTSPDGITWTARSVLANNDSWQDVTFGNGIFVAVSISGDRIMTSPDGINWTARTYSESNAWKQVIYAQGKFVAVACGYNATVCNNTAGGHRIITSTDGITWTGQTAPAANWWMGLAYGNGIFVAVSYDGTNRVMTSADGVTWSAQLVPTSSWGSIAFGKGRFVVFPDSGFGDAMTSVDGVSWSTVSINNSTTNGWGSVSYLNGQFIASGLVVMTSLDGLNWKSYDASCKGTSAYGPSKYVIAGSGCVMTSSVNTLSFNGSSAQLIMGALVGSNEIGNVEFLSPGIKTFANNASTSNFTIQSGATVSAPAQLSITGNYTNNGTFTHNNGTTTFMGELPQMATGTMTTTSSFGNIEIRNNSATTTFGKQFTAAGNFTATTPGSKIVFAPAATSTVGNFVVAGASGNEVSLTSGTPGVRWNIAVTGTSTVSMVRVQDSHACAPSGTIYAASSTDLGNNLCWIFAGPQSPTITLFAYLFRNDDAGESSATLHGTESSTSSDRSWKGDRLRLRLGISNTGTGAATNYQYRLQYSSTSCTVWSDVLPYASSSSLGEWKMDPSQWFTDGTLTQNLSIITDPNGKSFVPGELRFLSNLTGALTLSTSQFTELEYAISSTALVTPGAVYCFRLVDQSMSASFTYGVQPQILLTTRPRPQTGGAAIEGVGSGPIVTGGGASGGGASEGTGSGGAVGGGGAGGGGGLE